MAPAGFSEAAPSAAARGSTPPPCCRPRRGGGGKAVTESQPGSSLPCSLVKTPQHSRPFLATPLSWKRKPPRGGSRRVWGCRCKCSELPAVTGSRSEGENAPSRYPRGSHGLLPASARSSAPTPRINSFLNRTVSRAAAAAAWFLLRVGWVGGASPKLHIGRMSGNFPEIPR